VFSLNDESAYSQILILEAIQKNKLLEESIPGIKLLPLTRAPDEQLIHFLMSDPTQSEPFKNISTWIKEAKKSADVESKSMAIVLVDLVGSSHLKEKYRKHPQKWLILYVLFIEWVKSAATCNNVRVLKYIGDEVMLVTETVASAEAFIDELFMTLTDLNQQVEQLTNERINIKVAADFGEVFLLLHDDVLGTPVDRCARLEKLCDANVCVLSEAFFNKSDQKSLYQFIGERSLKGIGKEKVYEQASANADRTQTADPVENACKTIVGRLDDSMDRIAKKFEAQMEAVVKSRFKVIYTGDFPDFLPSLSKLIEEAGDETVLIATDHPAYGNFSSKEDFFGYRQAIEKQLHRRKKIEMVCFKPKVRNLAQSLQFGEMDTETWERLKLTKKECFRYFYERYRSVAPEQMDNFLSTLKPDKFRQDLELSNVEFVKELSKLSNTFKYGESWESFSMHFWIVGQSKAIFSLAVSMEGTTTMAFSTEDPQLIGALKALSSRYLAAKV
jgi:class 3 adenylate cyclase